MFYGHPSVHPSVARPLTPIARDPMSLCGGITTKLFGTCIEGRTHTYKCVNIIAISRGDAFHVFTYNY